MFLKLTRSKDYHYVQLVESYRSKGGPPRQRILARLGRYLPQTALASFYQASKRSDGASPSLSVHRAGDIWAAWHIWHKLDLDQLLPDAPQPVVRCLQALVFQHLCEPESASELRSWLGTTAWPVAADWDLSLLDASQMQLADQTAAILARTLARFPKIDTRQRPSLLSALAAVLLRWMEERQGTAPQDSRARSSLTKLAQTRLLHLHRGGTAPLACLSGDDAAQRSLFQSLDIEPPALNELAIPGRQEQEDQPERRTGTGN